MADYRLIQRVNTFEIYRDDRCIVTLGGPRSWAEERLKEYRDQETQALEALAAEDPSALCDIGWHRTLLPEPLIEPIGATSYFRFAAKIGEAGGTLVYRIAEGPFEYQVRTVKCLGSLEPWRCVMCERPILAEP